MTAVLSRALAAVTSRRRTEPTAEPPPGPFDCCPHPDPSPEEEQ